MRSRPLRRHAVGHWRGKRPGIVHRLDRTQAASWWRPKPMPRISRSARNLPPMAATGACSAAIRRWCGARPARPRQGGCAVCPRAAQPPVPFRRMKARNAVTHYQVQESFLDGQVTRLACHLETGRTHQIRVHMAHIGHPVLGDPLYGAGMKSRTSHLDDAATAALEALARQALHAAVLGLSIRPPARMDFEARAGGYGAPAGGAGKCVTPTTL